jgi:ubiquinone/menaquinone biosynthesis C-methylase UbiE
MSADTRQPGSNIHERIAQTKEYNFGRFAENPAYRAENRALIREVLPHLPRPLFRHVDLAAGTGLVSQVTIDELRTDGRIGRGLLVDPDPLALEIAKGTMPHTPTYLVNYEVGTAEDIPYFVKQYFNGEKVNWFSIHDAIHEVPGDSGKQEVFETAAEVLAPDGVLSMNSAFYEGAMGDAGVRYGKWSIKAAELAGERRSKLQLENKSPDDYVAMVEESGLTIVKQDIVEVTMDRHALEAISRYPQFVKGVFPHAEPQDIPRYSDALINALDNLQIASLPRNWFRLLAKKI